MARSSKTRKGGSVNSRIFNEQLAAVAGRTEEMHMEQSSTRQSGRTYRSVIRALLWASAHPNKRVMYATYTNEHAIQAFRMACDLTAGIDGRRAQAQERTITLPNRSVVVFRSSRDTGYAVGTKFTHLVKDAE